MDPVRQNPIQRTVRTAHLSVLMTAQLSVHNTAQISSDNLPSYLQTIIIAQMLSIGGEGEITRKKLINVCPGEHKLCAVSLILALRGETKNREITVKNGEKKQATVYNADGNNI